MTGSEIVLYAIDPSLAVVYSEGIEGRDLNDASEEGVRVVR